MFVSIVQNDTTPKVKLPKTAYGRRLKQMREEAKELLKNNQLPREYYTQANEIIKALGISPKAQERIVDILVNSVYMRSIDPETVKNNVATSAKLFNVKEKDYVTTALRQPSLLWQNPETLQANVLEGAKYFDIEVKKYVKIALNQPALFIQKPETIKNNVRTCAEQFGITEQEFIDVALKRPMLFSHTPERVMEYAKLSQYGKVIKGKKKGTLAENLNAYGKKYLFTDMLKFLISNQDNIKFPNGYPDEIVKKYLLKKQNRSYQFAIPWSEFADEFSVFAQKLSISLLKKNIFKFIIR